MPLILIWYSYSVYTYLILFVPLFVFNNLLLLFIVQLQSPNLFVYEQLYLLLENNWISAILNRWKDRNGGIIDISGALPAFTWRIVNCCLEPEILNKFSFSKENTIEQLDSFIQDKRLQSSKYLVTLSDNTLYVANDGIQYYLILRLISEILSANLANNLSIYLGSTILYYCIQPIDGDTVIVNQGYPFTPDLLYLSESYLHRGYRYISKTKQIRAEEIKKGPCKQTSCAFMLDVYF